MAAKIKIDQKEYLITNGIWICEEDQESAKTFQSYCDSYFAQSSEYLVDIDEQSAKLAQEKFQAEIISIDSVEESQTNLIY